MFEIAQNATMAQAIYSTISEEVESFVPAEAGMNSAIPFTSFGETEASSAAEQLAEG